MTQLVFVTDEQILRKVIREEIAGTKNTEEPKADFNDNLTRREAAKFLGISYQCMYNWTKTGIIKEHGHGRKKFYVKPELIEALKNNS